MTEARKWTSTTLPPECPETDSSCIFLYLLQSIRCPSCRYFTASSLTASKVLLPPPPSIFN